MWKVFTPIICLYFWLFMKCGAMAGELRLGESARILKNTRELLFSRTLSCSVPPCPLYFFLSFSLSHWLLQIPWPSWPTEYMLCTRLYYPNWSCRTGSTSYLSISLSIDGLSEFGSGSIFPLRIQGSCSERANILTSPINLLTLTVTDGTLMFNLQVMHSPILTQYGSSLYSWKMWQPLHHVLSGDFGRIVAQRDRVATIQESLVAIQQNRFHKIGHTIKYWYMAQEMNHSLPFFCFVIQN